MPVLNNVKVNWASVQEPNRSAEYGDKWEVEAEISSAQATEFVSKGFKTFKKKDKNGNFLDQDTIRIKRKTTGTLRKGGTFNKEQPKVVDSVKQPFTDLIGNGSVCNIAYNIYDHNFGTSMDLAGVQVLELVPYGGKGKDAADEFESVGGVSVTTPSIDNIDDCPF